MNKKLLIQLLLIILLFSSITGCLVNFDGKKDFEVTNLEINPKEANKYQNISISAYIKNLGSEESDFVIDLNVNGEMVTNCSVHLEGNEEVIINFTVSRDYGNYTVKIGEKTSNFSVGGVIIKEVNYDPEGKDYLNLNEEWVEVENKWNHPVDLTGWYLFNWELESDVKYVFKNYTLGPGEVVRVHSGKGNDTQSDLYWNWNEDIWDRIDMAYLYNESSILIDSHPTGHSFSIETS